MFLFWFIFVSVLSNVQAATTVCDTKKDEYPNSVKTDDGYCFFDPGFYGNINVKSQNNNGYALSLPDAKKDCEKIATDAYVYRHEFVKGNVLSDAAASLLPKMIQKGEDKARTYFHIDCKFTAQSADVTVDCNDRTPAGRPALYGQIDGDTYKYVAKLNEDKKEDRMPDPGGLICEQYEAPPATEPPETPGEPAETTTPTGSADGRLGSKVFMVLVVVTWWMA